MVRKKNLAILFSSALYGNQHAEHMCLVGLQALKKGYSLEIFLFGEGVRPQIGRRWPADGFPVSARLKELIELGAQVYGCDICSTARGDLPVNADPQVDGQQPAGIVMDGIKPGTISDLVEMLSRADKVLSFGGG